MKVNSGVTRTLFGTDTRRDAIAPGSPQAAQHVHARRLARRNPAATAVPPARHRARRPSRPGTVTLLTFAVSAALLGCSSLTSTPWRVQPAYRIDNGNPNSAQGYLALARQYEGEGRSEKALDAYRSAAKAAPTDADVQNAVGMAFAKQGQFAPAVVALRRAVALAPERAQLLNNLGYALLLDGRAEDARAMLRLTLAVNPTHEAALRNLAFIDQQLPAVASKTAAPVTAAADTPAVPPAAMPTAGTALAPVAAATLTATATAPATATTTAPILAVAATPLPAPSSGPTALQGTSIEIVNGNGITGAAARLRQSLREQGIEATRLTNLPPYKSTHTLVLYRPGKAEAAREVAGRIPVDAGVALAPAGTTRADLRVVLGHDVRYSAGCAALAACAAPERLASSVDQVGSGLASEQKARR